MYDCWRYFDRPYQNKLCLFKNNSYLDTFYLNIK